MPAVVTSTEGGIATVRLARGKVNALDEAVVEELSDSFRRLAGDPGVSAVIFTGEGPFFSFGFDIPGFLGHSKEGFTRYLTRFTALYTELFEHPKPVVAALNGHTIAGGCMLALACDRRIMATGKARISLNEIGFGSSVFAGSVEMLRFWVGGRRAQEVLYGARMYSAEEALGLGMIDRACGEAELAEAARQEARELAGKRLEAFRSIKLLLRAPVASAMRAGEERSIREFVRTWYSEPTWSNLRKIQIHA